MITTFWGETADEVWKAGMVALLASGKTQQGRGGGTREILHAGFSITDPRQRWIVSRKPALNPAFAIAEVVWILQGRNDSAFLTYWNTQLRKFVGNSGTYHGAYGHRIRQHFGLDQLERAYATLKNNPNSRQVILQIWDCQSDLPDQQGTAVDLDIPCNVMSLIKVREGKLEWMQINRSNDVFLGVPHNFIQFTTLQEILAGWLGLELGSYNHLSDSFHLYERDSNTLSIDQTIVPEANTDSLMLTKTESAVTIEAIGRSIELLISDNISENELIGIAERGGINKAYRNLLLIMCSESARRRKWNHLLAPLLNECTNPLLRQLWERWLTRVQIGNSMA